MSYRFLRCCVYAVPSVSNTSYPGAIFPNTCGSLPTQKGRKHKKAVGHHVTAGLYLAYISNRNMNMGQRGQTSSFCLCEVRRDDINEASANNKQHSSAAVKTRVQSVRVFDDVL